MHLAGLSNNRVARIAIGHVQLLEGVGMSICEYMILGHVFVFKSWVAYSERQSPGIRYTRVLSLSLSLLFVLALHIVSNCKIRERQGRKTPRLDEKKMPKERNNY